MIKEAIVAQTGILFRDEPLVSMGFDFVQLAHELNRLSLDVQRFGLNPSLLQLQVAQQAASTPSTPASEYTAVSRSPELTTRALIPVPSLDRKSVV